MASKFNAKSKVSKAKCPRCGSTSLMNFEDSVECSKCHAEFDKEDLKVLSQPKDSEYLLAIDEKTSFLKSFQKKGETDEEYEKRLKECFNDL